MSDKDDDITSEISAVVDSAQSEEVCDQKREDMLHYFRDLAKKKSQSAEIRFAAVDSLPKDPNPDSYYFIKKKNNDSKLVYTTSSNTQMEINDAALLASILNHLNTIEAQKKSILDGDGMCTDDDVKNEENKIKAKLQTYRFEQQKLQPHHIEESNGKTKYFYNTPTQSFVFDLDLKDNKAPTISSSAPANEDPAKRTERLTALLTTLKNYYENELGITDHQYTLTSSSEENRAVMEDICKNLNMAIANPLKNAKKKTTDEADDDDETDEAAVTIKGKSPGI